MPRLRTVLHAALAAGDDEVIAVGIAFVATIAVRARTFVGCRFDAGAAGALPPDATLIGCVFEPTASTSALRAVGTLPLSHPRVRELGGDAASRERALEQILEAGDNALLPLVCGVLADGEWLVRSLALQIATKCWQPEQAGADVMARTLAYALGDEHSMVQMAAQDFVQRVGVDHDVAADVVGELATPVADLRLRALRALVSLHRMGRDAGTSITESMWQRVLGDASAEVRLAALDTLAQIDHACPLRLVAARAKGDEDGAVRDAAQQLLDEQSGDG